MTTADPQGTRVRAARALGLRMDSAAESLARTPRWVVRAFVAGAVLATFPYEFHARSILGLPLDTSLTLWLGRLMVLGVGLAFLAGCFFVTRAILAFLEEGRWPRKAVGVEVDEHAGAIEQVERSAEALSQGADRIRYLEKRLKEAQMTIRYLNAELDRERGLGPPQTEVERRIREEER